MCAIIQPHRLYYRHRQHHLQMSLPITFHPLWSSWCFRQWHSKAPCPPSAACDDPALGAKVLPAIGVRPRPPPARNRDRPTPSSPKPEKVRVVQLPGAHGGHFSADCSNDPSPLSPLGVYLRLDVIVDPLVTVSNTPGILSVP